MKILLKPFLTIITIILITYSANAQEMQDVIYLKDGSVLHGKIIEIKANESITLQSNCEDTWVINQAEIDKITKEKITIKSLIQNNENADFKDRKGFYSNINIGFMFGGDLDTPFPPLNLMYVGGYQFKNGLGIGLGLGLDLLDETLMPTAIDLNYTFKKSKISHFIYAQGGYAFSVDTPDPYQYDNYDYYGSDLKSEGGYFINPGFGFKLNINERNAMSFSLGYKFMRVNHTYKETNGQEINRTIEYNRIVLRFGYHFW